MARVPKEERHEQVDAVVKAASENMHILEMWIDNIKRVKFAHIKPKNNLVIFAGKNGHGKTSCLDAVAWAFTGTSTVPRYPIRKGQRTGMVKVDIGDFIVTRHFTVVDEEKSEKGNTYISKLTVTGKRGEAFPSPQVLLDKLLGTISFDPLAFKRKDADDQVEELRKLVKFDVDIDAMEAEQKVDYDARREAGRTAESLKNRVAAMATPATDLPAQAIDTAAITLKLQTASEHNSAINQKRQQIAADLEKAERADKQAKAHRETIEELKQKIAEYEKHVITEESYARNLRIVSEELAETIPAPIDTAAVAAELTKANETNAAIQRAANYRQLEKDLKEADEAWAKIDKQMKARDIEREAAIARAKMPIEKLSIANGEVVYDGFPLSQASDAAQIRVSMAIGMAANPKLRVLCVRDGSLLDDDSLQLVDELAKANKYQVLIERVETTGNVSVIMEDGNATGDDVEVEK